MRAISLVWALLFSIASHAEMQIYTLPLKYQPPEDLIATLKPLIPEGGYLSSHGNNIIVRTNAENLAELQLLLDELDQPLAALMISVRRGNDYGRSNSGISVSGKYSGDNGGIVINPSQSKKTSGNIVLSSTSTTSTTTVTTHRTSSIGNGNNNYQVRGLEGRPSFIQTGTDVPINNYQIGPYGRIDATQQYKSANQGFYATARVYGERVNIDISAQHDTLNNSPNNSRNNTYNGNAVINTESVNTSVSGRLGEWIAIGGFNQDDNNSNSGLSHYKTTKSLSSQTIYLKVDRITQ